MQRDEKLLLSANEEYGHCFRQGLFAKFYEQSLFWFSSAIKPLKPMLERVKGGPPLVYGGLPLASLEQLLAGEAIRLVEATEHGWRWPYADQKYPTPDATDFADWRAGVLNSETAIKRSGLPSRNILSELRGFNLAAHTPLEAMSAIAEWQKILQGGERRDGDILS